jgi:GH25 family lysozyme M1 (1,4-beta-N-acetylmuramidase)
MDVSESSGRYIKWDAVARATAIRYPNGVVQSPIRFVIARATASLRQDTTFASTWSKLSALKWPNSPYPRFVLGAYHYLECTSIITPAPDGAKQANAFLNVFRKANGSFKNVLPPVLDIEFNTEGERNWFSGKNQEEHRQKALKIIRDWVEIVSTASGRTPLIYTNEYSWERLGNPKGYANCPLLVCNWEIPKTATPPKMPRGGWSDWTMWQLVKGDPSTPASHHHVAGYSVIDLNIFNGSARDLVGLAYPDASLLEKTRMADPYSPLASEATK